jgi:hypothetical protein
MLAFAGQLDVEHLGHAEMLRLRFQCRLAKGAAPGERAEQIVRLVIHRATSRATA